MWLLQLTKLTCFTGEQVIKLKIQQSSQNTADSPETLQKIKELEELNAKSAEEKSDLIKFVERLSSDIERLGEEVDSLRTRLTESREENSKLNKDLQDVKSFETTNKVCRARHQPHYLTRYSTRFNHLNRRINFSRVMRIGLTLNLTKRRRSLVYTVVKSIQS